MNNQDALYRLEGKCGVRKVLPYAIQQVLTMFVSNLVPIGIVAAAASPALSPAERVMLLQNALIASGIATILQATPLWKIGSGLPIFMGVSFTFVLTLSAIAAKYGYGGVTGAVLIGGLFEGFLGMTAHHWKKFMAPIVSALVVTGIGLSLLGTATRSFGGGYTEDFGSLPNIIVGMATILACLLWMIFVKGSKKQLSILVGLGVGYLTAIFFGMVDFHTLLEGNLFSLPHILPYKPLFRYDAIVAVCIIYLVSATETLGDAAAVCGGVLHREMTQREASGALAIDGFGSFISGLLGGIPVTSYSENIGLTIMTGVINRNVARAGGVILILSGLFPPVSRFVNTIPEPVIGGVLLMVLGQILISGVQMIAEAGFTHRNIQIASITLSIAIGFTTSTEAGIWKTFPLTVQSIFSQNVVAVIFVLAMFLNLVLPKSME